MFLKYVASSGYFIILANPGKHLNESTKTKCSLKVSYDKFRDKMAEMP